MESLRKIVIVDDNITALSYWSALLEERYGNINVLTFDDPLKALIHLSPDLHLLLLDLEMPEMDGMKMLEYAVQKGVRRNRTIILSSRDADHLHDLFPHGACLAVINKGDPNQQDAFLQILDSVMRRQQ